MSKPKILISLMTFENTKGDEFCRAFLDFLFRTPEIAPELVGNYEPVRDLVASAEAALPYCRHEPFLWNRKHPIISQGGLFHTYPHKAGMISLDCTYGDFDWFSLFNSLVSVTKADYGYLHLVTSEERNQTHLSPEEAQIFYSLGAIAKKLEDGFLELGWANYFGPRWKPRINPIKLANTASRMEHVGDGYLFTISDDMADVKSDYRGFDTKRGAVKAAFASGFFRSPMKPAAS